MLDTRNTDMTKTMGSAADYRASRTVTTITDSLVERYLAGGIKYGVFVDDAVVPTEITGETSFAQMAYNEALDGITYALKAVEELATLQQRYDALDANYQGMREVAAEAIRDNKALAEEVVQLRAEYDMLDAVHRQAIKDGDLSAKEEAELVHRNVALEQQLAKVKAYAKACSNRYNSAVKHAIHYKTLSETQAKSAAKVPLLIRKTFGA